MQIEMRLDYPVFIINLKCNLKLIENKILIKLFENKAANKVIEVSGKSKSCSSEQYNKRKVYYFLQLLQSYKWVYLISGVCSKKTLHEDIWTTLHSNKWNPPPPSSLAHELLWLLLSKPSQIKNENHLLEQALKLGKARVSSLTPCVQ